MRRDDPHIHVEANVLQSRAAVRDVVASTFGLAADLPGAVDTGCGLRVPYAMTSAHPSRVTCLACREHARAEHLRFAGRIQSRGGMPGSGFGIEEAERAAERHRALAARFADPGRG